jgi:hypothetical protein
MGVSKNYRFDHFTLCKMEPETLRKKARFASGVFFAMKPLKSPVLGVQFLMIQMSVVTVGRTTKTWLLLFWLVVSNIFYFP